MCGGDPCFALQLDIELKAGKEKVVTKTETLSQKEINRRKLAAARKADAEKYGEEYHEEDD